VRSDKTFDFITSIYAFPHFILKDLERSAKKIHSMLNSGGKFILVLADEKYLKNKLAADSDLLIEKKYITFRGKKYEQVLHFADIPKIGRVMDYDREEKFYIDLFTENKFKLKLRKNINDNEFISTTFIFEKV
jgi:cyclopropane fatty-acyl-phospholipid synthase-like methyltransferase